MKIEDILRELKEQMTIVLVTNLVQQARRLADRTAFFSDSRLIEVDETETIFTQPANRLTERYVNGDFGYEPTRTPARTADATTASRPAG